MSRHGEGSQGERAAARPAAARRAPHHSSKLIPHASGCTSRREARNSRQRGGQNSCCTSKHPPRRPRTAIVALKRPLPLPFPDQCKAQAASLRAAPRAKPLLAALKRTQGRSCHIVCPHFFPRRAPLHAAPHTHAPNPHHSTHQPLCTASCAQGPQTRAWSGARGDSPARLVQATLRLFFAAPLRTPQRRLRRPQRARATRHITSRCMLRVGCVA